MNTFIILLLGFSALMNHSLLVDLPKFAEKQESTQTGEMITDHEERLVVQEIQFDGLLYQLTISKANLAEYNSYTDTQVQLERFTCLESGIQYDDGFEIPLLVVRQPGGSVDEYEFSPIELLSNPFTCVQLDLVEDEHLIRLKKYQGDNHSRKQESYLWDLNSNELTLMK